METNQRKRLLGLIIATGFILIFGFIPELKNGMTHEALVAIGLFGAAIALWVCEVFPMAISAALIVCLYSFFGVMTFPQAISGFSTSSVIFIFGTFAITAAIKGTTIPLKLTTACIKLTGGDSRKIIFAFCLGAGLLSGIMSSAAVCVTFWSIALIILNTMGAKPGKSELGKVFAIILPAACGMGGFITPAGTPGNVLMIDFMAGCGIDITFAQWTLIGLPIGVIGLIVLGIWSITVFHPENITEEAKERLFTEEDIVKKWTSKDKKTLVIILAMLVMWFMGSWISCLNTATVAVIGMVIMFLPGIDVLGWNELKEECNVNMLLMIGLAPIISNGLSTTGALDYLVKFVFGKMSSFTINTIFFLTVLSIIICIMRAFIPTPAAVVSLLGPLMYSIASATSMDVISVLMTVGFWSAAALLLLYTEPIYFFTFGHGYYTEKDVLKCGVLPCMVMAIVTGGMIPVLVKII